MVISKCTECGKEFKKENATSAAQALRMHIKRVHQSVGTNTGEVKKRAYTKKPAPPEPTPDVSVLCDVIVRLLAHISEGGAK